MQAGLVLFATLSACERRSKGQRQTRFETSTRRDVMHVTKEVRFKQRVSCFVSFIIHLFFFFKAGSEVVISWFLAEDVSRRLQMR